MITPVFICTGFLDSGKTTLIKEVLMEQDWINPGKTLLILCEEGEEEYSEKYLKEKDMIVLNIEEFSQLNVGFFKNCERQYRPSQVVIEYNGTWKLEDLLTIKYPRTWQLQGVYSTVNGETLELYLKNMRNMLMEQLTESELIVVNRCSPNVDRSGFRRAIKVQNPMADLIFEGPDGKIIQPTAEDLPYDVKADKIVIEDDDFGIWYVDAYEHPQYYQNKEIEFKAQAFRPRGMKDNMFELERQIMTCCADDINFYGCLCKADKKVNFAQKDWVKVRAKVKYEAPTPYDEEEPVLYLLEMEAAEKPAEEVVYL